MKSAIETMKRRKSVRNFDSKRAIEPTQLAIFKNSLDSFETDTMRFALINTDLSGIKLGTYGMISGANHYIVGILKDITKENTVAFGSQFEKIVLEATDLGLGTCWMIGTYNPDDFSQYLNLQEGETIVIVSPLGYANEKERLRDKLIRTVTKNHTRQPFGDLFFENNAETPLTEVKAGDYAEPLEMVRIAPSASNKQPWRILKVDGSFHFYFDTTRTSSHRGINCGHNDLGIAMEHFELTCRELNLSGEWKTEQAPNVDAWEYIKTWSAKSAEN